VGLVVLGEQVLAVDAGVDLRGGQAGVAEQLLNGAQVGPPAEQVSGKGVAQRMRCGRIGQAEPERRRCISSWMLRAFSLPPRWPMNNGP
jgi:hypothetical protein